MEKTLNMGAFEVLDNLEMMEVDGGYTFLCNRPQTGTFQDFARFAEKGVDICLEIIRCIM